MPFSTFVRFSSLGGLLLALALPAAAANQAPVASAVTNAPVLASSAGQSALSALVGTDPDGTVASFKVTVLPTAAMGTLQYHNGTSIVAVVANSTVISYARRNQLLFTPSAAFTGSATFKYVAVDNLGAASVAATYTIPVSKRPVAADDVTSTASNTAVTVTVTANDTDADGTINAATVDLDPATAGIQSTLMVSGQGTYSVAANGSVTFAPVANYTNTSTISYTVQDNSGLTSNAAAITVKVGPVAADDAATTIPNTPVTIGVLANDADANGLNVATVDLDPATSGQQTSRVIVGVGTYRTTAADGTVTFTPAAGYTGTSNLSYVVADQTGAFSNVATLFVNVGPLTAADAATVLNGQPVTINVLANDQDANGLNAATVDLDPTTAGRQTTRTVAGQGTFEVSASGVVTFTPDPAFVGTVSPLSYVVADQLGAISVAAPINVRVEPYADLTTGLSGTTNAAGGTAVTYTVTTRNLGPAPARDVVVEVQLPERLKSPSGTNFQVGGATYDPASGVLTYNTVSSLPSGQELSSTFSFRMPNTGSATGVASAQSTTSDPNLSNNDGSQGASMVTTTGPLPVELLFFTAKASAGTVVLTWATAQEKDAAYFAVERSANGREFAEISRSSAAGTSVTRHDYTLTDARPLAGTSYYRLRQVDQDGTITYSPVQSVRVSAANTASTASLYPNPAVSTVQIDWGTTAPDAAWQVQVLDLRGRLVQQTVLPAGQLTPSLDVAGLPTGTYVVRLASGGQSQTLRLTKE